MKKTKKTKVGLQVRTQRLFLSLQRNLQGLDKKIGDVRFDNKMLWRKLEALESQYSVLYTDIQEVLSGLKKSMPSNFEAKSEDAGIQSETECTCRGENRECVWCAGTGIMNVKIYGNVTVSSKPADACFQSGCGGGLWCSPANPCSPEKCFDDGVKACCCSCHNADPIVAEVKKCGVCDGPLNADGKCPWASTRYGSTLP